MKLCEEVLLYAQGELFASKRVAFEAHLKTCPACQKELKFLAKLDESLTPPAAPQRVVDELFARTTRKKSVWALFKWGWVGVAAAACAAFVWTVIPTHRTFNASELVAYMNDEVENEYSVFAAELTDMENYL